MKAVVKNDPHQSFILDHFQNIWAVLLKRHGIEETPDYLVNHELRCIFVTYLWPAVAFAGDDVTRDKKERVLMSVVKAGAAKKSSKIPAGGVGPS